MTVDGTDTTFSYDAWGRTTRKAQGSDTADYYYHYGSKLTKVSSSFPGEGTVTYKYGGVTQLGPAIVQAKLHPFTYLESSRDLIESYTLFGDPATRLNVTQCKIFLTLICAWNED